MPQGKCMAYTRESPYTRIWEEKIAFGKKLIMFAYQIQNYISKLWDGMQNSQTPLEVTGTFREDRTHTRRWQTGCYRPPFSL